MEGHALTVKNAMGKNAIAEFPKLENQKQSTKRIQHYKLEIYEALYQKCTLERACYCALA